MEIVLAGATKGGRKRWDKSVPKREREEFYQQKSWVNGQVP
ncbi:MAG: hypothetical protein AAB316_12135 [Bacteroidota bacterium]